MTAWEFIKVLGEMCIQFMKDTDFFFGISMWQFLEIFLAFDGLIFIVASIFKSRATATKEGEKEE
jgi:hypothetical protein